jgi:hypothetical protein
LKVNNKTYFFEENIVKDFGVICRILSKC